MPFLTEPAPTRGVATPVAEGIWRIVANNAAPMTFHGTNTYLVAGANGFTVIDPGPQNDEAHIKAILAVTSGRVERILITHFHHDHVGGAAALKAATDAQTYSFGPAPVVDFVPDIEIRHGDVIGEFEVVHTPGHSPDHISFAYGETLFSGDHVMAWSSTIVSPPHGRMADYIRSLRLLLERNESMYLPGHGPALREPQDYVRGLIRHRQVRENEILELVRSGITSEVEIAARLYNKPSRTPREAAVRHVISHLEKLITDGVVQRGESGWVPLTSECGQADLANCDDEG